MLQRILDLGRDFTLAGELMTGLRADVRVTNKHIQAITGGTEAEVGSERRAKRI